MRPWIANSDITPRSGRAERLLVGKTRAFDDDHMIRVADDRENDAHYEDPRCRAP